MDLVTTAIDTLDDVTVKHLSAVIAEKKTALYKSIFFLRNLVCLVFSII